MRNKNTIRHREKTSIRATKGAPRRQLTNRLGQFRAMETIIITIILTIMFITGYAVYSSVSNANFEQKKEELDKSRMSALNILISNLPELKCSTLSVTGVACIDKYKAEAFINLSEEESFRMYEELFGDSVVELQIVNLGGVDPDPLILYNGSIENYTSVTPVFNPVSYYDPVTKKAQFAVLVSTFYVR